jgi:predicted N-acetyltransferase YhbS
MPHSGLRPPASSEPLAARPDPFRSDDGPWPMTTPEFSYRLEQEADGATIDTLHDVTMGPGRFARAAFRLREGVPYHPNLSFVATVNGLIVGSVRMTPILIGGRPALLLGPLAVHPDHKGQGAGRTLVRLALHAARSAAHKVVMLVGDEPYYGPLGFTRLAPGAITLPAPVDPLRVLVAGLQPGALDGLAGPAEALR